MGYLPSLKIPTHIYHSVFLSSKLNRLGRTIVSSFSSRYAFEFFWLLFFREQVEWYVKDMLLISNSSAKQNRYISSQLSNPAKSFEL